MKGILAHNTLIKQVQAQIEQRLKTGVRESYQKIVISGMKFILDKGPDGILAQLGKSQNVIDDAVKGAIGVVGILRRAAKGVMPADAMVPAAMTLMLEALDYAERVGLLTVDTNVIDQATHLFIETISPRMGVTPQKLGQLTSQVHGIMQDPDKMARITAAQREQQQQQPQPGGSQ